MSSGVAFTPTGLLVGANAAVGTNANASIDASHATDAISLPVGTTAQRPTGGKGMIRFNTNTNGYEGFITSWQPFGGGTLQVQNNNVTVNSVSTIDFLNTASVKVTANDDYTNGRVQISFTSTGGGGGGSINVAANNSYNVNSAANLNYNNTSTVNVSVVGVDGNTTANIALTANVKAITALTEANVTLAYGQANAAYAAANAAEGDAQLAIAQFPAINSAVAALNSAAATDNTTFGVHNSIFSTLNTTFGTTNTQILLAQNTVAVYANGTLTLGNANLNFNNTATVNVHVLANGTGQVNVSFDANVTGGGGSSPLTTKGDLYGHSTVDARIPVGADGYALQADSTQPLGVAWKPTTSIVGGGDGITAVVAYAYVPSGSTGSWSNYSTVFAIPSNIIINGTSKWKFGFQVYTGNCEIESAAIMTTLAGNTNVINVSPITFFGGQTSFVLSGTPGGPIGANIYASDMITTTLDGNHDYYIAMYMPSSSNNSALSISNMNQGSGGTGTLLGGYQSGNVVAVNPQLSWQSMSYTLYGFRDFIMFDDGLISAGGAVYSNGALVLGLPNANINFNNTATVAWTITANGTGQVNISAAASGSGGGGSANVYANSGLILATAANLSFYNTATTNAVVTANGTQGVNIAISANATALGIPALNTAVAASNTNDAAVNSAMSAINSGFSTTNTTFGTHNTTFATLNTTTATMNTEIVNINAAVATINTTLGTHNTTFATLNTTTATMNTSILAAGAAVYRQDGTVLVLGMPNANLLFGNSATINALITANGTSQVNLYFLANSFGLGIVQLNSAVSSVNSALAQGNAAFGVINTSLGTMNTAIAQAGNVQVFIGNGANATVAVGNTVNGNINFVAANIANLSITGTTNTTPGNVTITIDTRCPPGTGGGGGTPGGSNTYVQFNNGGAFGGTANLTFDVAANSLNTYSLQTLGPVVQFLNTPTVTMQQSSGGGDFNLLIIGDGGHGMLRFQNDTSFIRGWMGTTHGVNDQSAGTQSGDMILTRAGSSGNVYIGWGGAGGAQNPGLWMKIEAAGHNVNGNITFSNDVNVPGGNVNVSGGILIAGAPPVMNVKAANASNLIITGNATNVIIDTAISAGGSVSPAGPNNSVQINSSGVLSANARFTANLFRGNGSAYLNFGGNNDSLFSTSAGGFGNTTIVRILTQNLSTGGTLLEFANDSANISNTFAYIQGGAGVFRMTVNETGSINLATFAVGSGAVNVLMQLNNVGSNIFGSLNVSANIANVGNLGVSQNTKSGNLVITQNTTTGNLVISTLANVVTLNVSTAANMAVVNISSTVNAKSTITANANPLINTETRVVTGLGISSKIDFNVASTTLSAIAPLTLTINETGTYALQAAILLGSNNIANNTVGYALDFGGGTVTLSRFLAFGQNSSNGFKSTYLLLTKTATVNSSSVAAGGVDLLTAQGTLVVTAVGTFIPRIAATLAGTSANSVCNANSWIMLTKIG